MARFAVSLVLVPLAALALATAGAQAAPVSFAPKVDYPAGATPWAVAVADLNRDGTPDLAVTNIGSNTVSVLLGKGDGTFGAHTDFAVGEEIPTSAATPVAEEAAR